MQTLASSGQANPEVPINENFDSLSHMAVYGKNPPSTTGLTWGYYGGRWGGIAIADGTVTLTNAAVNYLVVQRSTGTLSAATTTTNWLDTPNYARVYALTTAGSVVTASEDHRAGPYGVHGLLLERRVVPTSTNYTLVAADAATTLLHPSADASGRTWTIPANSSVPYPIGTELEFMAQNGAGVVTININTDTLRLAGAGTAGARTLAANGWARAKKITATEWLITNLGGLT